MARLGGLRNALPIMMPLAIDALVEHEGLSERDLGDASDLFEKDPRVPGVLHGHRRRGAAWALSPKATRHLPHKKVQWWEVWVMNWTAFLETLIRALHPYTHFRVPNSRCGGSPDGKTHPFPGHGRHWETRSSLRMFHLLAVIDQECCFGLTYK